MHAACPATADQDAAIADVAAAAAATGLPDPLRALRSAADPRNEIAAALAAAHVFLRRDAKPTAAEIAGLTLTRVRGLEAAHPQIVEDMRVWLRGQHDAKLARATGLAQVAGVYLAAGHDGEGRPLIADALAEGEQLDPGSGRCAALTEAALALRNTDGDRARDLAVAAAGELDRPDLSVDAALVHTVERLVDLLVALGREQDAASAWASALRAAERDPGAVLGLVAAGGGLLLGAVDAEGVPAARRIVELLSWFTLR
jgi:hypothetical protein